MKIKKNRNLTLNLNKNSNINMNVNNRKTNVRENNNFPFNAKSKSLPYLLILFVALAGIVLSSPDVLAVGDSTDAGLSTGVTNLLAILNNKLTPVVLIAGCLASLIYSFAIAQPKPFILGLVTLCGFGFAKAWIAGTYALIG